MSDVHEPFPAGTDEEATARLLHVAGPRAAVPTSREQRVRSAVREAWRLHGRRRVIRRRIVLAGSLMVAASLIVVVGRGLILERAGPALGSAVALVDKVEGTSSLRRDQRVGVGESIETGVNSRVALRFSDGTSARLDTDSSLRVLSPRVVELSKGAVYVDTGHERGGFEVRTSLATARDIGTQFEVRLIDDSLRLRVRTGIVELTERARSISGRPGTEITLTATGAVSRPIAVHGAEWDWTTHLSPPIEMEGLSLARFLERLAREHGWTVEYRDPGTARNADGIILHGSVSGLPPQDAVAVAIATSGLRHRLEGGVLVVLGSEVQDGTEAGDAQ